MVTFRSSLKFTGCTSVQLTFKLTVCGLSALSGNGGEYYGGQNKGNYAMSS